MNIAWEAYVGAEDRAALKQHFDTVFGVETYRSQGDCDTWRFPPTRPTSLLQVCAPHLDGPWRKCGAPPPGTGAVLLVSELTAEPIG